MKDLCYIILLNYNNWKYTINCIKSLYNMGNKNFKVIVLDNNSTDDSLDYIYSWVNGGEIETFDVNECLNNYITSERVKKEYIILDASCQNDMQKVIDDKIDIIIIKSKENIGYSSGNNIATKLAIYQRDCAYIWILNNDTIVDSAALSHLVLYANKNPFDAIIGSTLMHMDRPNIVQALGGSAFNYYFARGTALNEGYKREDIDDSQFDNKNIGYVSGASMFITKNNLKTIGLMPEDFVLYFEEIAWCKQAQKRGYNLGYEPKSIIYHKYGATTKLLDDYKGAGNPYHFLYFRNKLVFTRRFIPKMLFTVYIGLIIDFLKKFFIDKEFKDCKIFYHWEMWKIPKLGERLTLEDAKRILTKGRKITD